MNADEQAIVKALEGVPIIQPDIVPGFENLNLGERKRVAAVVAPLIEAARNSRPNKGEVLAVINRRQPGAGSQHFRHGRHTMRDDIAADVEKLFTDREPAPFRTPGFDGVEGTEYDARDWRA